eukprot:6123083-Amphidinium_carterae.4
MFQVPALGWRQTSVRRVDSLDKTPGGLVSGVFGFPLFQFVSKLNLSKGIDWMRCCHLLCFCHSVDAL